MTSSYNFLVEKSHEVVSDNRTTDLQVSVMFSKAETRENTFGVRTTDCSFDNGDEGSVLRSFLVLHSFSEGGSGIGQSLRRKKRKGEMFSVSSVISVA